MLYSILLKSTNVYSAEFKYYFSAVKSTHILFEHQCCILYYWKAQMFMPRHLNITFLQSKIQLDFFLNIEHILHQKAQMFMPRHLNFTFLQSKVQMFLFDHQYYSRCRWKALMFMHGIQTLLFCSWKYTCLVWTSMLYFTLLKSTNVYPVAFKH